MKNLGTILAALFLAIVLLLYMCTFQVRYTEVAIKKTWGRPDAEPIAEPGLKFKWPAPIQQVEVYDNRIRILEDKTEETRTRDAKNLLLTTYALWKIGDPAKFLQSFPGGVEEAEKKLRTTVITYKHAVTGTHDMAEFISTDPAERKLTEIEQEMKQAIAKDAWEQYGIRIVDNGFGIKKLGLPEKVTSSIFENMKRAEEKKAATYIAEGEATANDIIARATAVEKMILSAAQEKARRIRNDADRIVGDFYKEFDQYPELRIYLDKLRTLNEALSQRSTLVFTSDESPFDVFDAGSREKVYKPDQPVGDADKDDDSGADARETEGSSDARLAAGGATAPGNQPE